MSTTARAGPKVQRPTFGICQPWCAGHLGAYQSWTEAQDGLIRRYHYDHSLDLGEVSVTVRLEEILAGV